MRHRKTCAVCATDFSSPRSHATTCSATCRSTLRRDRERERSKRAEAEIAAAAALLQTLASTARRSTPDLVTDRTPS